MGKGNIENNFIPLSKVTLSGLVYLCKYCDGVLSSFELIRYSSRSVRDMGKNKWEKNME